LRLAGKVALVAGASSGIGAACALELARRGVRIVAAARRLRRLEELACAIRAARGPEPLVLSADLTEPKQVADLMAVTQERLGGLDLLLYSAGVGQWLPLLETSLEQTRRILEVNLVSAIGCLQAAAPLMRRRGGGLVVLISSVAGLRGMPGGAVYSASKAAYEGLCDALRVELAPEGIELLTVYPSLTRTEFFEHLAAGSAPPLDGKWAMSAEKAAQRIVRAIERGRRRAVLSAKGQILVALARVAPRLLDALERRRWRQRP
jgi:short-subunit dehydrogenase